MDVKKEDLALALLQKGSMFVHLDPRLYGVMVPFTLKNQPQVVLQFGYDMPVPIPDMVIDDEGISGTLSFKGEGSYVMIPWSSVFALVGEDSKGMVWEDLMPPEIKNGLPKKLVLPKPELKRPQLKAINGGLAKKKSHLRLVK